MIEAATPIGARIVELPVFGRAATPETVVVALFTTPPPCPPGEVVAEEDVATAQPVFTLVLALLLFDVLPVVAEPPLVLPETLAVPDVPVCELLLVISVVLLQFDISVLVLVLVIVFVEPGPVLLMLLCAAATPLISPIVSSVAAKVRINFLISSLLLRPYLVHYRNRLGI